MLKGETKDRALWKLVRVMDWRFRKGWEGTRKSIEAETRERMSGARGASFTTCM